MLRVVFDVASASGRRPEGKDKMVASAMTRRAALAALGAFALSLTCAAPQRARPKRPEVSRHRGQRRAPARELRRSDRDMDGAGAHAGPAAGRLGRILRRATETPRSSRSRSTGSISARAAAGPGRRALRRTRSSEPSSFGDREAESCRKCPCGQSHSIIRAPSTRRWSSKPITGAWSPWRRPSRAGRQGSSGFSRDACEHLCAIAAIGSCRELQLRRPTASILYENSRAIGALETGCDGRVDHVAYERCASLTVGGGEAVGFDSLRLSIARRGSRLRQGDSVDLPNRRAALSASISLIPLGL